MNAQVPNLGELDLLAAAAMWAQYAAARPEAVGLCPVYTVECFGDSPALADALLHEVLHGTKRATSTLAREFLDEGVELPRVGSHWIACDSAGAPRAILRSIELRLGTFADADADFARDEGEDDLSLESWRHEHRKYWRRTEAARSRTWNESDTIVFERFELAWPFPLPELPPQPGRGTPSGRTERRG
ncbi:ASCH domain-containing protein [Paeniglutamicibacter gangotriensis]|uniref:Asch domain superfamily protein n=1 Tax=Paeniglutamicibacter gangotriensis Lz1y TaxID=1276920 RepID=M7NAW8_9MICC|nr:ASCH domain-containing protein [Paeniglutamicibacter gangotriensis]EMQ98944.1 asch domain superfamily protein [Paeniglutamicibacter gangotriensis Lz1y]